MNKKVLTLCAGFLLAGGMLSTANASLWESDDTYVLNTGKYHVLGITARSGSSGWEKSDKNGEYVLSVNDKGEFILTKDKDSKNAYWTITTVSGTGTVYYQLKNANGETLKFTHAAGTADEQVIDKFRIVGESGNTAPFDPFNYIYYEAKVNGSNKKFYLQKGTEGGDVMSVTFAENARNGKVVGFNNFEIPEEVISARDLNAVLKDGFGLVIGSAKDKEYTSLQGNVFTGEIEAKNGATTGTYYFYRKADKKYIVLSEDVWSENTANLDGKERSAYAGYKFEAISEHAFGLMSAAEKKAQAEFQVLKSYDFNDTDSLIVTLPNAQVGEMPATWTGDATSVNANQDKGVRLFVSTVDNKDYLTVIEYAKANDRLALQHDDAYSSYEVGASAPYIQLGLSNIVDFASTFAGKIWNITDAATGKVLTPAYNNVDHFNFEFIDADQIQLNKPEGEWLPYYNKNTETFGFVNRESGHTWSMSNWVIRSTSTPNLYEVYNDEYTPSAWYKVFITPSDAKPGKTENGYAKYDAAVEALNGKYLTLTNGVTGETVYVAKDADDNVILSNDKSKAIEFRVKELKHDYTDHDGLAGVDTLQHITNYLAKADLTTDNDTIQFYHYRLFENFSEKYLVYDNDAKKFVLSNYSLTDNAHEDFRAYEWLDVDHQDIFSAFVLKEKQDDTYNLISGYGVVYDECNHSDTGSSTDADFDNDMNANLYQRSESYYYYNAEKMYGAFQTATLANMAYIYNFNDNDRFGVVDIATPEYMTITDAQDTIKVSLQNFQNFYLYEQGINGTNFLGMNHVADVDDMKAAIYVDTAFVRNDTYRPQYLLAMNGRHVEPIYDSHPDHTIPHLLHADTTYGRFLVNMVDSAATWKGSDKTNPYIWDKSNYYRLAFIDGIHTGDKLILNTAKAKTTIDLSNNNDKVCTFAFRYVDEDREGVKIETLYGVEANGTPIRGWLKYQNNVPVVTNDYDDAHVFLVDNTTTEAPTANEEISANAVVSVVATDGAVIVKGAEGKNVIVSTILGKVVANEVLNSDNETIAAPAGIVVVSVDGESFKVAVK